MQKNNFIHTDLKAVCNSAAKKLAVLALVAAVGGTGLVGRNCRFTASAQTGNGNPANPGNGHVGDADLHNAIDDFLCYYAKKLLKKLTKAISSYERKDAVVAGVARLQKLLKDQRSLRSAAAVIRCAGMLVDNPANEDTFCAKTETDERVQLLPVEDWGEDPMLRQMTLGNTYADDFGVDWTKEWTYRMAGRGAVRRLAALCAARLNDTPAPNLRTADFAARVRTVLAQVPGHDRGARLRYMHAVHDALMLLAELPPANEYDGLNFLLEPQYAPGLWYEDVFYGTPGLLADMWDSEEQDAWPENMRRDDMIDAGGNPARLDADFSFDDKLVGDEQAGEPAGDEHAGEPAGDEHAGEPAGDEHAGEPGDNVNRANGVIFFRNAALRLPNGDRTLETVIGSPRAMSPSLDSVLSMFSPDSPR